MYLQICETFMSANHKKLGSANPKIATFAKGPQIEHRIQVRKVADLQFANLFADRPPLPFPYNL
jgi:hypothetical protein